MSTTTTRASGTTIDPYAGAEARTRVLGGYEAALRVPGLPEDDALTQQRTPITTAVCLALTRGEATALEHAVEMARDVLHSADLGTPPPLQGAHMKLTRGLRPGNGRTSAFEALRTRGRAVNGAGGDSAGADAVAAANAHPMEKTRVIGIYRRNNHWLVVWRARSYAEAVELRREIPGPRLRPHVDACPLTGRELEVLQGLAEGKACKQIAHELTVSHSTVRSRLHSAYGKLGVRDRAQAVLIATDRGWLAADRYVHLRDRREIPNPDDATIDEDCRSLGG
jgi:DNA-binding CsgD family transcriptional regulator